MANSKISALTAATTPVAGTEVLPIVQSGATVQVSINAATGITRPFTANGVPYASSTTALTTGSGLTFNGANLVTTGTASATKLIPTGSSATGNGLYLPATNSLGLSTNGSNAVYIDANQNVGIGSSTFNSVRSVIQGSQTGGAPQTSGTAQTYGILRLQGTSFSSVLDFGTNGGNYAWIQSTDNTNLSSNYSLAINPNGGNVGIGVIPNASALLDVQSTTKGVRMPNMTTTQKNAISGPAAGLIVFDTTLSKLCVYSGAAWQTITSI